MSIKALVNNKAHLDALVEYLDGKKEVAQKSLNQATELHAIFRLQGEIRFIEKMKLIREEILANEQSAG